MKGRAKAAIAIGSIGGGIAALWALTRKVEAKPEYIMLSDLAISPTEVYVGEPVEISIIATNVGEQKATREITCEVL